VENNISFTDLLNEYVNRKQLNAYKLSQLTKVSKRTIQNWLDGTVTNPRDWLSILEVANALGLETLEVNELLQKAQQPKVDALMIIVKNSGDTNKKIELFSRWINDDGTLKVDTGTITEVPVLETPKGKGEFTSEDKKRTIIERLGPINPLYLISALTASILIILAIWVALSNLLNDPTKLLKDADSGLDKGQYENAIEKYGKLIKSTTDDSLLERAYHGRCRAFFHKDVYDNAILDCNEAVKITPTNGFAYYTLGLAFYEKALSAKKDEKDFDNAIKALEKVTQLPVSKGYCWGYVFLALAYKEKGETKKAVDNLKTALTVPNDSGSCWNRAREQLDLLGYPSK